MSTVLFLSDYWLDEQEAKSICATCPVITECLNYAFLLGPDLDGVYGGTTKRERKNIRQQRSRALRRINEIQSDTSNAEKA